MKIKIPFLPIFKEPMLNDTKTMTCRKEKCGQPGDTFEAFGATFEITHVMRMRLGFVGSDCFKQEGCKSEMDFIDVWQFIHPVDGFDEGQIVWAHCFRMIHVGT